MNRYKVSMIMVCCVTYLLMVTIVKSEGKGNQKQPVRITVIGGEKHDQGSAGGSFEAHYSGKKVNIAWSVAHSMNLSQSSVKVYIGDKEIKQNLDCYLVRNVIKGKRIGLIGRWQNQNTFEAYKIYLPPDTPVIQPYTELRSKSYFCSRRLSPAAAQAGKPVPPIDC